MSKLPGRQMIYTMHGDARGVIIVARDLTGVCGYIQIVAPEDTTDRSTAEIRDLHVVPGHRRKGIGTHLVTMATEWARKARFTYLSVEGSADNENFYRSNGFETRSVGQTLGMAL